jgi:biotin carboxylase
MKAPSLLLMLGAGVTGRRYLEAARAIGADCALVERSSLQDTDYGPLRWRESVPNMLDEQWFAAALRGCAQARPDGVIAFGETHVTAAALLAERLGLRGPGLAAAIVSRDKSLQRGLFDAHGLPQPRWTVVPRASDAVGFVRDELGPTATAVVKPVDGSASLGVQAVDGVTGLLELAASRDAQGKVLVEEYIDGVDFSWEAIVAGGSVLCSSVTSEVMSGPPDFVELAHGCGPDVVASVGPLGDELGQRVVRALGVDTGMVHLELRVRPDGTPVVIEVAVRTPGCRLMDLFQIATGIDAYRLLACLALGQPAATTLHERGPARSGAAVFFTARPGSVESITGVEEARRLPGVRELRLDVEIGSLVRPLSSAHDRVGQAIVCVDSPDERDAVVAKLLNTVVVNTTQEGRSAS